MNSNTATFFFLTNEEIKQINSFLLIKKKYLNIVQKDKLCAAKNNQKNAKQPTA